MNIKLTFLSALFALSTLAAIAQSVPEKLTLKGKIIDSASQQPVEYATLTIKNSNKQAITSTLSKGGGAFAFEKLTADKYALVLVSIGYTTKQISVDLTGKTGTVDLGKISFSPNNKQLKGVNITADKAIIKQEADRLVYDLQADPESKVYSVLEMMRKVPLLSLDGEDNILLKGNANYKILINGKPSSMVARNPKDVLRSMPASTIDRIEVITTPPAKYDAEGLAGIINIITHKAIDNGYNGSANLNGRFPVGGPGAGGNLTFKQGKFGMFLQGGGSIYNTPVAGSSSSRITTGTNATSLFQNGTQGSDSRSGYLGTELSYELDTLNLISGSFNINGNRSERNGLQTTVLNGQSGVLQGYSLGNVNNGNGNGLDGAINYQHGFKKSKSQMLTFSYRYLRSNDIQFGSLDVSDQVNFSQPDYHQNNNTGSEEHTFQIDYVQPVKKLTIEMGIKGIWRNNTSDFDYQILSSAGNFVTDPLRSNIFDNRQHIYGAYNSYQYSLQSWDFKAGIRIEETSFTGGQIDRDYFNLIPSASVSRRFKNGMGVNLGYSERIQRPGISQLNPFVDRSNPNFYNTGNGGLDPVKVNNFSLGFSSTKKVPVNVELSVMLFHKLIMPAVVYDQVTHVTTSTLQNTGNAQLVGLSLSSNYDFTKKWSGSLNGRIARGHVSGLVNGILLENDGFMEFAAVSTGYRFSPTWRINASFNMNGPDLSLQGSSNWNFNTSLSMNKDIVKNKLSLSVAANNPFSKFRNFTREFFGPDFDQFSTRQNYYRSFNCSLNYRFGKLKDNLKKTKKGIQNDDAAN